MTSPLIALASIFLLASAAEPARWAPFEFLIGDWTSEGGGFSFQPDLQGRVLIRRNWAESPAAGGKPASRHEDLMLVYAEEAGKPPRAIYLDNEGHVIHYAIESSPDSIRFISPAQSGAPRYRLTYRKTGPAAIAGQFEIAPPDKPDGFAPYLAWTATRKPRQP